jgi:putative Holliday junction resolvase
MMKIMALDYGEKRVGLASTDEGGTFALPRVVLPNDAELLHKVLAFKMKEGIHKVVLGESKNLDGTPNPINTKIEEFKAALEAHGVEVVLHPEVFTTREARQIQGNTSMTDASAAAIILKNYLDSVPSVGIEPTSAP